MAKRALVLGGGGVVGIAWETGVLKGLADAGLNPADADLIIGTSAGSVVGTQIRLGYPLDALLQAQHAPTDGSVESSVGEADVQGLMNVFMKWAAAQEMTPPLRAEIGKMALAAKTTSEERFVGAIGSLLAGHDWPEQPLIVTAVQADSGEFVTWDRSTGVPLHLAIASSCAVPGLFPPVTINGLRYVDGGVRSGTSADLARGYDVVLVIAPIGASAEGIGGIARRQLDAELDALRAAGSVVELILPDAAAMQAFGPNLMDPARRTPAAQAGLTQGAAAGQLLASNWSGSAARPV